MRTFAACRERPPLTSVPTVPRPIWIDGWFPRFLWRCRDRLIRRHTFAHGLWGFAQKKGADPCPIATQKRVCTSSRGSVPYFGQGSDSACTVRGGESASAQSPEGFFLARRFLERACCPRIAVNAVSRSRGRIAICKTPSFRRLEPEWGAGGLSRHGFGKTGDAQRVFRRIRRCR